MNIMSNSQSVVLDLLLDLFRKLQDAGMALTLEQYEILRKAFAQGYVLG